MDNNYKNALDKIRLANSEKEKARNLFYEIETQNLKGRSGNMKANKFIKPVLAVAASLIVILAGNILISGLHEKQNHITENNTSGNSFSVTAYAKEITKTGKVFPNTMASLNHAIGWDSNGRINFSFLFPLECKGKNIDTVTYKIKEGVFEISNPAGKSIVIHGEKPDTERKFTSRIIAAGLGDDKEAGYEFNQYKSFTLDYNNQTNDKTCISISDVSDLWSSEKKNEAKRFINGQMGNYEKNQLSNLFTKNLGITCTVTYNDGSTDTKNISVSSEIVKPSDVLDEEIKESENYETVAMFFSIE